MLKRIVSIASVSVIASYLYAKLIEKRSYKSFLYEIMIRATKMKQPFEKKVNAQKHLNLLKHKHKASMKVRIITLTMLFILKNSQCNQLYCE